MLIGMCGLIGSGKDTCADFLVHNYNFKRESFANHLKDIVSIIFGWDRELLEGRTDQSRQWREQVDTWWSQRLNMTITPRWILQHWGTDVLRNNFHNDIWIASLENKLSRFSGNVIITDCRFPNEIDAIKKLGGTIIRVVRGPDPLWFEDAKCYMQGPEKNIGWALSRKVIEENAVHPSEYSWANTKFDYILDNNGSINGLYDQIKVLV